MVTIKETRIRSLNLKSGKKAFTENVEMVLAYILSLASDDLILRKDIDVQITPLLSYLNYLEKIGKIKIFYYQGKIKDIGLRGNEAEKNYIRAIQISHDEIKPLNVYSFVDVPNITENKGVVLARFNWFAFLGLLNHYHQKDLTVIRKANVYCTRLPNGAHDNEWAVYKRMQESGFSLEIPSSPGKDIDPLMIEHILALSSLNQDMILNIVSGDIDFFSAVKTVKENLKKRNKKVIIRIFSWQDCLNKDWTNLVDEIFYLDDVIRFIDFPAKDGCKTIRLEDFWLHPSEIAKR